MPDDTLGVEKFQLLCESIGWVSTPIATATTLTPDFVVRANDLEFLVEVKTFVEDEPYLPGRLVRAGICKPGERIRHAIRKANKQFRTIRSNRPSLLVICNTTTVKLHTAPYSVMTAMRGIDYIKVSVPADLKIRPTFDDTARSGKGQEMRADTNTSTSAIGVLHEGPDEGLLLYVYHNRFAAVPLDYLQLQSEQVRHFVLPANQENSLDAQWMEI